MSNLMTDSARKTLAALKDIDSENPAEELRTTVRQIIDFAVMRPEFARILSFETVHESARLQWLIDRHLSDVHARITDMIRRGQAQGTIIKDDPDALYFAVFGLAQSSFVNAEEYRLLTGKDPFATERIEGVTRRCFALLGLD